MRFTTEGLVIREKNIGETDRLVTLLTPKMGVIHAFAPGAKSIKSKKGAATGLLSYASFTLEQKKDSYRIYEATPIRIFFSAGTDILCLALSQYFCELCAVLVPRDTDSEEYLRLILNSLHFLFEEKKPPLLLKGITELRLASLSGFCPDLVACAQCGAFEEDEMRFSVTTGKLLCGACGKNTDGFLPVSRTVLSAMRHIVYSEFNKIYAFEIPPEAQKQLQQITEKYMIAQTEHYFSTLNFYHSIC